MAPLSTEEVLDAARRGHGDEAAGRCSQVGDGVPHLSREPQHPVRAQDSFLVTDL
jgi:hypothetical protein